MNTSKKKRRRQQYLAFGQKDANFKSCKECGMIFTPQITADSKFHKCYHESKIPRITTHITPVETFCDDPFTICITQIKSSQISHVKKYLEKVDSTFQSSDLTEIQNDLKLEKHQVFIALSIRKNNLRNILGVISVSTDRTFEYMIGCIHEHTDGSSELRVINPCCLKSSEICICSDLNKKLLTGIYIEFVWVHPQQRRKGLGIRLINYIKKQHCFNKDNILLFNEPQTLDIAKFFAYCSKLSTIPFSKGCFYFIKNTK